MSFNWNRYRGNKKKAVEFVVKKGKFPCGVWSCRQLLSSNYDVSSHQKVGPIKHNPYKKSWSLEYDSSTYYDLILCIHSIRFFFVKVYISLNNNVYGHVQIADSTSVAQHFYYTLEMGDRYECFEEFHGQVESTAVIHKKSNFVSIDDLLWEEDGKLKFDCVLTITYVP